MSSAILTVFYLQGGTWQDMSREEATRASGNIMQCTISPAALKKNSCHYGARKILLEKYVSHDYSEEMVYTVTTVTILY